MNMDRIDLQILSKTNLLNDAYTILKIILFWKHTELYDSAYIYIHILNV